MGFPKIEIKSIEPNGVLAEISVDGHKIKGVTRYNLEQHPGEIPILTLDLFALNLDIDLPFAQIRIEKLKDMEISFSGKGCSEKEIEITRQIDKLSCATGIAADKILEFVKQNRKEEIKNG